MLPASFYNANTQALLNITDIYNLKQLITEPTRITPLSSTLIDVIFTNLPDNGRGHTTGFFPGKIVLPRKNFPR